MGNELTWGMLVILYLSRSVPAVGRLNSPLIKWLFPALTPR